MKVKIFWSSHYHAWTVLFLEISKYQYLRYLRTRNYSKAYFWKKYEKDLDDQFLCDYAENV